MAADATLPLQAAIVAAVAADNTLGALGIDTVYDHVPDHLTDDATANVPPYCSFGPFIVNPWNTQGRLGSEAIIQIDTWSRERGRVKLAQIMSAMRTLLERQDLILSGTNYAAGWLALQQVMKDPDGVTMHGVQQFRFLTAD